MKTFLLDMDVFHGINIFLFLKLVKDKNIHLRGHKCFSKVWWKKKLYFLGANSFPHLQKKFQNITKNY
jgi:hypothetical protein